MKLADALRIELYHVTRAMALKALSTTFALFGGRMVAFSLVFWVACFSQAHLRPVLIFPALALTQTLRGTVLGKLNYVTQFLGESKASTHRIQVFIPNDM